MTVTGWRWEEVDEVTLEQVDSLFGYWRSHPPVHEMVAGYLGIKPETQAESAPSITASERDFVERMQERMVTRG